MNQWVPFGQIQGIQPQPMPLAGAVRIDNLDDNYVIALRNNIETGKLQLVTYNKAYFLRVSDFVQEYAFPDYKYPPGLQANVIAPIEATLMKEEGYTSEYTTYGR